MSHFEYVSVAVALIYALVVGRLLAGLAPSLEKGKRCPIHALWVFTMFLVCILQWWLLWRVNEVEWTAFRFLWILAFPCVLYIRAAILMGNDPGAIDSYRDHFFANRQGFFGMGVVLSVFLMLAPWVTGIYPWLTFAPTHPAGITLVCLSIAGMVFSQALAHWLIALLSFALAASSFMFLPPIATG